MISYSKTSSSPSTPRIPQRAELAGHELIKELLYMQELSISETKSPEELRTEKRLINKLSQLINSFQYSASLVEST